MHIVNIIKYGVFNSKNAYHEAKFSPLRIVKTFEFDYILSCDASATSYIDDKSCNLIPNTLIIRKPNQKSNSRLHFKCYCLHLQIEPDNPLFDKLSAAPNYFTFINDTVYRSIFEELLLHLTKNEKKSHEYFINAKILELIYHIEKDKKYNQNIRHTAIRKENRSIKKAISFMRKNYDKPIQLKELGKITGYSPNHFQHLFTETMGISPSKYLEKIRIAKAKYLLMENEKTLCTIAYECGFSSQSYFSKIFKKHTLISPHEYKTSFIFKYSNNSLEDETPLIVNFSQKRT